jgi:cutinase
MSFVKGVVVFGDPFDGAEISGYPSSKIKTYCATGDFVCSGEFIISAAHLSYVGTDTQSAAQWIKTAAGL